MSAGTGSQAATEAEPQGMGVSYKYNKHGRKILTILGPPLNLLC